MKHNQILRRGLSILLSLVLCLSLLPATALAEGTATATETADFTTDAEAALALLNAAKTEGAANSEWDPATSTLTLKGVDFTTSAPTAVRLLDGATIVLADGTENTIANVHGLIGDSVGIRANGNITIQGSGTLTVTAGEAEYSSGIYADAGDITISGGTVTATGGEAEYSSGIDADGVTITGGTVTATGGKAATNSRGIDAYTNVTISGGTVTATGGETTHDSWGSNGIDADGVTISGGTVTATGGKAAANSCGIYAYTNVTITGGTLTVTAGTAEQISCGIYGYTNVTITGGTVTATGGEAEYSCGIDSDGVTISGGTVTATGGKAATNSYGIYAINNVTISGGHVTAQTVSTTATTESALNVAPDLSSYTGYRWRTSASGDFTSSADTAYTYRESDTYVEFSQGAAPTTYTVRFNANGGSGEMTDVTDVSGDYTLPTTTTFTAPSGKQFAGWATSASGTVITDTTITVTEDTTLYAVWEDISDTTCDETADFTTDAEAALALLNAAKTEGAANSEWDPATSTLTLKGVDFTTSAATAVRLPDGAKIVLADGTENTIANVHGLIGYSFGIRANGNITIQGSGTLTVTAGTAAQISCGIYADGNVTISGGTVTATGGETTQDSRGSNGINADGVTISGGTVTATGGKAANNSRGIYAYTNVTISGGTVTATGGEATGEESESYGIYGSGYFENNEVIGGNITISGGTVTAKGGTAGKYSYGICSYYGGTTISGGTVNATGGTATGEKSDSYGILANTNIKISGGSVTATGSTATDESFGIFAYDTISISDTAEVTATGGNADLYSDGIYADGAVTISGGTVTATGGEVTDEASESFGIESYDSETIIISGGHVIAQTLAGESATTRMALNAAPNLSGYTGYRWRTSADGNYTVGNFVWNTAPYDTYVEIAQGAAPTTYTVRFNANGGSGEMTAETTTGSYTLPTCTFTAPSGKQFAGWATSADGEVITGTTITVTEDTTLYAVWATDYGVTVNGEKVTSLNKDNVLGNDTVRYDPATNTLYAENLYAASLNVVGNGSTDVVISSTSSAPAVGALTVTGAKDVTVTANSGAPAIYGEANITCTGNVTITNSNGMAVSSPLTVTGATDVTVEGSGVPAIAGNTMITCTGNVTITNSNGMAVSSPLTVDGAKNVTITANSSSAPAIGGNANITCSGDVTISNTGGGKAVAGNLTYQNASGKHSYTVKTGDSLENLTDYATKEAGDTFTATLDAAAVKITVAHVLTYVEAKAATCTEDGNLEHWACTLSCGKLFLDENGTTETTLEAVTIKAGHTADEWHSDSTQHWQVCTVCGEEFNRANHTFIGNTCTVCGYTKPSDGGSSTPTYAPTVTQPENGAVTVSPKAPKKGDTVTITPKPEDGYTVEQILVTDKNGDPVKVTNNGDGTYSFTQPAGKVTVKATFMEDNSMLNFFVDVPAGAYYYDAVLWAAENGITSGVDDTHFAPNSPCTRAQIVTFLWRAAGSPAPKSSEMPFEDVAAGSYYYDAVLWAVENGITKGTSDTTFSPNADCTRAQIVTFLWRSQGSPVADAVNPFTDVAADAYYAGAVLWAVENGVTNGTSDTTFSPNANCTRAQIVTFLYRCLGEE